MNQNDPCIQWNFCTTKQGKVDHLDKCLFFFSFYSLNKFLSDTFYTNRQTTSFAKITLLYVYCNTLPGGLKLTLKIRIGKNLRRTAVLLLQAKKLHIEYKCGVGRDDARVAFAPISKVRGASELSTLAYTHLQSKVVHIIG